MTAHTSTNRQRAQAIVELALILPVVLVLLVGLVDVGRIAYYQIALANAAREGARIGTNALAADSTIRTAVVAAARPAIITTSDVTITPTAPRSSLVTESIRVTVRYAVAPITPGASALLSSSLVNGKIPIQQTVEMAVI